MTKKELRGVATDLAPVTVEDGGIFESAALASADEGGARKVLFQGERRIAEAIAFLINREASQR